MEILYNGWTEPRATEAKQDLASQRGGGKNEIVDARWFGHFLGEDDGRGRIVLANEVDVRERRLDKGTLPERVIDLRERKRFVQDMLQYRGGRTVV